MQKMKNQTSNHINLTDLVKTEEEAKKLEGVIVRPYTYIERAAILLKDFISEYFDTEEGLQALAYNARAKSEVLRAKLESIFENVNTGERMLNECCEYKPE